MALGYCVAPKSLKRRAMAKAGVESGPVVETVSRKRIVSPQELQQETAGKQPEFWSYIEELQTSPDAWANHTLYVYRIEPRMPNTYEPSYVDRSYDGMIAMPNGQSVPFSADAIKDKFGGRIFRFVLKKGSERICEGKLATEAAPRYPEMGGAQSTPLPSASGGPGNSNDVAVRAIDAVSGQQSEGVRLGMEMLRTASTVIKEAHTPALQAPATNPLMDRLMEATLARLLDPPKPADPLAVLGQLRELRELFQPSAKSGLAETLELITALKGSGLINTGGRGAGLVDLAGQVLPDLVKGAVQGVHEWRLGVEAQERAIAAQRGGTVPARPNPPQVLEMPPPQQAPAPAAPAPSATEEQQPMSGDPPLQWLEMKIVQILKEPSYTVDQAVDEILAFLYVAQPAIVAQLIDPPKIDARLSPGEQGLLQLFQNEPILQQIPVNARLTEFIKKFITVATEAEAERTPKPKIVPTPTPATPSA